MYKERKTEMYTILTLLKTKHTVIEYFKPNNPAKGLESIEIRQFGDGNRIKTTIVICGSELKPYKKLFQVF